MKRYRCFITLAVFFCIVNACNDASSEKSLITSDTATVAAGKVIFDKHCTACHDFVQDGIGPKLGGITNDLSVDWLHRFIKNPQQVVSSGDTHANALLKKYPTMMPAFSFLKDKEVNAVIAFLNTKKSSARPTKDNVAGIVNPIPEKIKPSGLVVNVKQVIRFPPSSTDGKFPMTRITKLQFQPNTNNMFVNDLRGKLYKVKNGQPVVYLNLPKLNPKFLDDPGLASGFGSFAFHPDYQKNGLFYTTHTEKPGSGKADFFYNDTIKVLVQWVLTEWKAANKAADTFAGTSRELFRINMVTGAHGVQEITFNPLAKNGSNDYGLLYIGIGDGGSVQVGFPFITSGKNKAWGSIFRIDPSGKNSRNGQYGIPPQNPFVNDKDANVTKEIYAYGFRNPHRISWTSSGKMIACNIGQANIESMYLIKPGQDYGWPSREGSFAFNPYGDLNNIFPLPANDSIYKITYPVAQFDHDEGLAISGGYEYTGTALNALKGKFLFGDIPSGRLFYVNTAEIRPGKNANIKEWKITIDGNANTLKQVCGSDRVDLHFGAGPKGELFLLTKADGKLYEVEDAALHF